MLKNLIKSIIALAIAVGIPVAGFLALNIAMIPFDDAKAIKNNLHWFLYFLVGYYIVIRPVCAYWCDKLWELFDLNTTEKDEK